MSVGRAFRYTSRIHPWRLTGRGFERQAAYFAQMTQTVHRVNPLDSGNGAGGRLLRFGQGGACAPYKGVTLRMRLITDTLVALMLVGLVAGVVLHHRHKRDLERRVLTTRAEVDRFQSQIMLQAAIEKVPLTQRGYPVTVEPEWFGVDRPMNYLLGEGYPWVEIARSSRSDRWHPVNRVATTREVAQFWYNPYTGVVRARVPDSASDATAGRLYDQVNYSDLGGIE